VNRFNRKEKRLKRVVRPYVLYEPGKPNYPMSSPRMCAGKHSASQFKRSGYLAALAESDPLSFCRDLSVLRTIGYPGINELFPFLREARSTAVYQGRHRRADGYLDVRLKAGFQVDITSKLHDGLISETQPNMT
jgi:hypothetical protein